MKDTYCALPWMHLYANEMGEIHPCCVSTEKGKPAHDSSGNAYRVYRDGDLERAWNSPYMTTIRRQMLSGQRPEKCAKCYENEDHGSYSYRQGMNSRFAEWVGKNRADARSDGTADFEITFMDLRLGNLCNLRCRMCSPISSKSLIAEWLEIRGLPPDSTAADQWRNVNWFEDESFWGVLSRHLPSLERLHFAGGEPLIIPQMYTFLEKIVATGHANKITLSYNTNMTTLPDRVFPLWKQFKSVNVMCSIDGYGAVNDYIRDPSKWDKIAANLMKLDALAPEHGVQASINTTVQIYNVLNLPQLLNFMATTFKHINITPDIKPLTFPPYFSIQALPSRQKNLANEALLQFVPKTQGLGSRIQGLLSFMNAEDRSDLFPEFLRVTAIYDRKRGQSVFEVIPELKP